MPVKKAENKTKKAGTKVAPPAKKTAPAAKKASSKKKVAVGDGFECKVCGLVVSVIDDCGCVEVCDLICCEKPMKPKKVKAA